MDTSYNPLGPATSLADILAALASVIDSRAGADPDTSYTAKLLFAGPTACAKKLGEEAVETALAAVAQTDIELAGEAADLLYHLLVTLRSRGVSLDAVAERLAARQAVSGLVEKASR